ncbi:MAG: ABC transporter substrate-binding protein [Anaeromyxobacter sp.]|nr:ABC transporter substrate-binding protein [Anaeromyxobacter sp.]MBL0277852.1 ABC transporter substrate-binding protein [Anaeromyxobacter sp.]
MSGATRRSARGGGALGGLTGCAGALWLLLAPGLATGAAPRPLTPQQQAGRTIYLTGESPSGGGITATVGVDASPIPGSVLTCGSCHGEDGLGRPEGSVDPSIVTWSELTRAGGHVHPGRRHRPFDARTLARSITDGVDPDGQRLDGAMPRYSMSREDLDALVAWMKVLELQLDPGLTPTLIRLGTVLPEAGPAAEVGRAMRATLEAAVKEVNAAGGLNGRRLSLAVAGYDPGRESAAAAARRLSTKEPVFAMVSGFAPGGEEELAAWAEAELIPQVGPFSPVARPPGAGHYTFYLQPGPRELARVLVEHAARQPGLADPRLAVLRPEGAPALEAAARGALEQAAARGWRKVETVALGPDGPSREEVARLADQGTEVVLLLGDDRALAGFLSQALAAGWTPWVMAPGTLAARGAAEAPAGFDGRVLLAYPALPEGEASGRARLARLAPGAGERHLSARASAAAATTVLAEALRRTGRQLSRARLVASLEGLYQVETGLGSPVSFGPRRRVGAQGGYVVAVDLARRSFRPVGGWIRLD